MLPPGPRSPALWQAYRFIFHPAAYTRELQDEYGDVVRFESIFANGVALMDPALSREVFAAPPETFETVQLVEALFGSRAVIAVAGERHKKLRKLLNPRFHGAQVKGFMTAMQRVVRAHMERLEGPAETGEVVVVAEVTQALALDVILETVFGSSPDLDRETAREVLRNLVHGFHPAIVGGRPFQRPWFPPWRRFVRARAAFDAWADGVIRTRRKRGEDNLGDDVLGVLLAARYEDGAPMEDADVRDQLVTLLLAGHETSAIAMAWAVYHLIRTPEVLERLRADLDALGPDPAPEAVARVPYLDAVVSETLRIEPVVTDVVRMCRVPFTIGNKWTVPKGEAVAVMLVAILRDARVFPEPARFRPERFLEKKYGISEFLPFGGGARRCLGAAFAEAEVALTIAEIASRWDLELATPAPERAVRKNLTMGPANGVRVRVRGRRTPAARRGAA